MDQHAPIGAGYMAGHPERSDGRSDALTLPYRGLADDEVISEARKLYRQLQDGSRWANNRGALLVAWRQVCEEMNIRELTGNVTYSAASTRYRNEGLEDSETREA
jgi:hypothetical protein